MRRGLKSRLEQEITFTWISVLIFICVHVTHIEGAPLIIVDARAHRHERFDITFGTHTAPTRAIPRQCRCLRLLLLSDLIQEVVDLAGFFPTAT